MSGTTAFNVPKRTLLLAGVALLGGSSVALAGGGGGDISPSPLTQALHSKAAEHIEQSDLNAQNLIDPLAAYLTAFDHGDELFEFEYNALDGGGSNVGHGERWSRVPRADLNGPGEWANHIPARSTGPNGNSCLSCHNTPVPDGSGLPSSNVHRDPQHRGIRAFIQRNTPQLFALGALQKTAEEMTTELHAIRDSLIAQALSSGRPARGRLVAKGVDFGGLSVRPDGKGGYSLNTRHVEGVDDDLVVKPFQWKGSMATVREFNVDAAYNELGLQSEELVGALFDGDYDGVVRELTVGDQTALTIYLAAQPRPTNLLELERLGLIAPLSSEHKASINRGRSAFYRAGCAECHVPHLYLDDPVFSEPSLHPSYQMEKFPSGDDPVALGLDPENPIQFDMTTDIFDNITDSGQAFGNLNVDHRGRAVVAAFTDMKRHDLGYEVAEQIDETGHGKSTFLTEALWGVGSSAPYMHDGASTTINEAIERHGGDAAWSRSRFQGMSMQDQLDLIALLEAQVIVLLGE